jgi:hypothetical protein
MRMESGDLALDGEDLRTPNTRFTRALKICRDAQDKRSEAIALWRRGRVDAASGARDFGTCADGEALLAFKAFEMNSEAVDCLEDYAELLRLDGDVENAVQAYAAVAAIRESAAPLPAATKPEDRQPEERRSGAKRNRSAGF